MHANVRIFFSTDATVDGLLRVRLMTFTLADDSPLLFLDLRFLLILTHALFLLEASTTARHSVRTGLTRSWLMVSTCAEGRQLKATHDAGEGSCAKTSTQKDFQM